MWTFENVKFEALSARRETRYDLIEVQYDLRYDLIEVHEFISIVMFIMYSKTFYIR